MPELEVPCTECDRVTVVREHPATRSEPSWVSTDVCACGASLDFDEADYFDAEEAKWANHPDV